MQIVIDIPEDTVNKIKDNAMFAGTIPSEILWDVTSAIINGTLLPKGHGKLKDFDKIEWYGCDFEGKACERVNGDCSVCNFGNCDAKQVRELPTIIEADKESEVEE